MHQVTHLVLRNLVKILRGIVIAEKRPKLRARKDIWPERLTSRTFSIIYCFRAFCSCFVGEGKDGKKDIVIYFFLLAEFSRVSDPVANTVIWSNCKHRNGDGEMPRGVKTDALTTKAIKLLKDELTALELATLFKVPRRTIYDVVRRIEQREWEERIVEEERIRREVERRLREKAEVEQDRVERDDGSLSVSTLREGWERASRNIRRFRS